MTELLPNKIETLNPFYLFKLSYAKLLRAILVSSCLSLSSFHAEVGSSVEKATIQIACLGDSITHGVGSKIPYPERLQGLLGTDYEVKNFGVDASTLLRKGDKPYIKQPECQVAVKFAPRIVVIMLGTNDSKASAWKNHSELKADLKALVDRFRGVGKSTKIFICTPPVVFKGAWGIDEGTIQMQVVPSIQKAAKSLGLTVIEVNDAFKEKSNLWYDGVHLNQDGSDLVAETVRAVITGSSSKR